MAIVLFDGCIVELRAFVTANSRGTQCSRLSFLLSVFSLSFFHPFFHSSSIVHSLHRANRFDSCLANESTFPPNRQNKSSRWYNVDDFVTIRVCSASDLRTNKYATPVPTPRKISPSTPCIRRYTDGVHIVSSLSLLSSTRVQDSTVIFICRRELSRVGSFVGISSWLLLNS